MENGKPFQQSNNNSPSITHGSKNTDHFVIDDLLDLQGDENMVASDGAGVAEEIAGAALTAAPENEDFCNLSPEPIFSTHAGCFMDTELCIPYADAAELEWISSITEDSFSNEEFEQLQLIQGLKSSSSSSSSISSSSSLTNFTHSARPGSFQQYHFQSKPIRTSNNTFLRPEVSVPAKARSKRPRAAPENWTSRLRAVSNDDEEDVVVPGPTSPESNVVAVIRKPVSKPKKTPENSEGRKCLHCSTDKTPQWRTGPMGPKTLCNACGVRYKSGRLVPEYRPAASPTFAQAKHSNSHRKVMELRRQNEMLRAQEQQQQHQNMVFDHHNMVFDHDRHRFHHHVPNGENYMIHPHVIGASYGHIL